VVEWRGQAKSGSHLTASSAAACGGCAGCGAPTGLCQLASAPPIQNIVPLKRVRRSDLAEFPMPAASLPRIHRVERRRCDKPPRLQVSATVAYLDTLPMLCNCIVVNNQEMITFFNSWRYPHARALHSCHTFHAKSIHTHDVNVPRTVNVPTSPRIAQATVPTRYTVAAFPMYIPTMPMLRIVNVPPAAKALACIATASVGCVAIPVPVLARGGAVCAVDFAATQARPGDMRVGRWAAASVYIAVHPLASAAAEEMLPSPPPVAAAEELLPSPPRATAEELLPQPAAAAAKAVLPSPMRAATR